MNAMAIGAQAWTLGPAKSANASSKRLARIGGLAYLALAGEMIRRDEAPPAEGVTGRDDLPPAPV